MGASHVAQQSEVDASQALGLIIPQRREERGRADEVGEQERDDRGGDRRVRSARRAGGNLKRLGWSPLAAAAQLLGQRTGRLRRDDPQLVAEAAAEPLKGPDRRSAIAGRGQPPHQLALGVLGKRIERHLPAGVVDRAGHVPVALGGRGQPR